MNKYIVIKDGVIVAKLEGETFDGSLVGGGYDTVAIDPSGLFNVGDAYTLEQWELYNLTLDDWKNRKNEEIRQKYAEEEVKPVAVNGVTYHGGFDSAIKLDAAMRLAEAAGSSNVTFYDVGNVGVSLTLAAAKGVVLSVAAAASDAMATKQALMLAIKAGADTAAVRGITWPAS